MSEILGITPPPEEPAALSPGVARDIQRDTIQVALHDVWFNSMIGVAFLAGAIVMLLLDYMRPAQLADRTGLPLAWEFGLAAVFALWSACDAWRAYRRMRAADAAGGIAPVDLATRPDAIHPERHWLSRRSRQVILVLLLVAAGYQWYATRRPITGSIVFHNATITTGTGFVRQHMTVAVADGRIVYVGDGRSLPRLGLDGARQFDARAALVSAATFDHSVRSPIDGLRHVWAGQLVEGAPADLLVTTANSGRGRSRVPDPKDILAAVVNGRYYSADELAKIH